MAVRRGTPTPPDAGTGAVGTSEAARRDAQTTAILDQPAWHASLARLVMSGVVRTTLRLRVEGIERYPGRPAVICFSHQSWFDPFVLVAALPGRPRISFFGPKEADMSIGWRNRLMSWIGWPVPFHPAKDDLIGSTRRVGRVLERGHVLLIAGEGRIHVGEGNLLPLSDGPAYFALRSGVPLVPVAVNGLGWIAFGRTVRVRVGEPIPASGRPTRENVDALTARCTADLRALIADFPDRRPPGPFWQRVTELFNDWAEGSRPPVSAHAANPVGEPREAGDERPAAQI
jgi:1-acyl-sn-glycerol-3-phosphate acyltransferase